MDKYNVYSVGISASNRSSKIRPSLVRKPINFNANPNHFMSVLPNCNRFGYRKIISKSGRKMDLYPALQIAIDLVIS